MFKKVLKTVFPTTFLKHAFLIYNQLRIKTIDKILFPEYVLKVTDFIIKRDEYPFLLIPVEKKHLDHRLRKQFDNNNTWSQDEYLLVYHQPCLIEPDQGWALTNNNELIYPSLGFGRAPYVPKPKLKSTFFNKKNVRAFDKLISLRDTGEENYFHFYNDVLAKLFFLEEHLPVANNVPVLISKKLFQKPFFQYFISLPCFKSRNWIVQDKEFVQSNLTYFCKPLTHTKKYYDRILNLVPDFTSNIQGSKKVFITRSPERLRFIENNDEIQRVCAERGFEVIDFDKITLEEQMQMFAKARYVIGIHGAGLTNMIYRRSKPMSILEIFPPGEYFPFHYVLLATQFGYSYDGIIGEKSDKKYSGGFYLDTEVLKEKIDLLLK